MRGSHTSHHSTDMRRGSNVAVRISELQAAQMNHSGRKTPVGANRLVLPMSPESRHPDDSSSSINRDEVRYLGEVQWPGSDWWGQQRSAVQDREDKENSSLPTTTQQGARDPTETNSFSTFDPFNLHSKTKPSIEADLYHRKESGSSVQAAEDVQKNFDCFDQSLLSNMSPDKFRRVGFDLTQIRQLAHRGGLPVQVIHGILGEDVAIAANTSSPSVQKKSNSSTAELQRQKSTSRNSPTMNIINNSSSTSSGDAVTWFRGLLSETDTPATKMQTHRTGFDQRAQVWMHPPSITLNDSYFGKLSKTASAMSSMTQRRSNTKQTRPKSSHGSLAREVSEVERLLSALEPAVKNKAIPQKRPIIIRQRDPEVRDMATERRDPDGILSQQLSSLSRDTLSDDSAIHNKIASIPGTKTGVDQEKNPLAPVSESATSIITSHTENDSESGLTSISKKRFKARAKSRRENVRSSRTNVPALVARRNHHQRRQAAVSTIPSSVLVATPTEEPDAASTQYSSRRGQFYRLPRRKQLLKSRRKERAHHESIEQASVNDTIPSDVGILLAAHSMESEQTGLEQSTKTRELHPMSSDVSVASTIDSFSKHEEDIKKTNSDLERFHVSEQIRDYWNSFSSVKGLGSFDSLSVINEVDGVWNQIKGIQHNVHMGLYPDNRGVGEPTNYHHFEPYSLSSQYQEPVGTNSGSSQFNRDPYAYRQRRMIQHSGICDQYSSAPTNQNHQQQSDKNPLDPTMPSNPALHHVPQNAPEPTAPQGGQNLKSTSWNSRFNDDPYGGRGWSAKQPTDLRPTQSAPNAFGYDATRQHTDQQGGISSILRTNISQDLPERLADSILYITRPLMSGDSEEDLTTLTETKDGTATEYAQERGCNFGWSFFHFPRLC